MSIDEFLNNKTEADSSKFRQKVYENYAALVRMFPKSEKLSYYLYGKGSWAKSDDEAKTCFKQVIEFNNWQYYVRKSYMRLSWYAFKENDFKTASQCLNILKTLEKPNFTCGNEMRDYYSELKRLHESIEKQIGK